MRAVAFGEWRTRAERAAAFDADERRAARSLVESAARLARVRGLDPWTTTHLAPDPKGS